MDADQRFYEQIVSLLLSLVCLIEREKLNRLHTTAELRKVGKEKLAQDTQGTRGADCSER